jgi:hypothetical protein
MPLLLLLLQIGMKAVRGKEDAFNACAAGTLSAALLGAACEWTAADHILQQGSN